MWLQGKEGYRWLEMVLTFWKMRNNAIVAKTRVKIVLLKTQSELLKHYPGARHKFYILSIPPLVRAKQQAAAISK